MTARYSVGLAIDVVWSLVTTRRAAWLIPCRRLALSGQNHRSIGYHPGGESEETRGNPGAWRL